MKNKIFIKFILFFVGILGLVLNVQAQEISENILEMSPEEKIKMIEEGNDVPVEIKKILIEQIKNPQEKVDVSKLPQVNCTDYYKFQSVQVSLGADKDSYSSGETVKLKGELINENDYPVVDGNVFARVSRKNQNYIEEGNFVIDEFLIKERVVLKEKENQVLEFDWNVPANITGGDYRIDYFFSVGKKFNLGGLPFSNEVVIGVTEFSVISEQKYYISFDRSNTVVNEEKYKHIGNWPVFGSDEKIVIKQPILNSFDQQKEVKIVYKLYHWDSLNEDDLKESRFEEVIIPAKSFKELEYIIPQMDDAVYYLQIIAESGSDKSIVNIRLTSPQENIRLNYPAITKFPITQGDNFILFSCFHNGSSINSKGMVEVVLTDEDGAEVGKFNYEGIVTAGMLAEKSEINAKDNYDYLKLIAKVYNEKNEIVDKYEVVYDCKLFNNCINESESVRDSVDIIKDSAKALVIIFLVIALMTVGFLAVRRVLKK